MGKVDEIELLNRYWNEIAKTETNQIEVGFGQRGLIRESFWPETGSYDMPADPLPRRVIPRSNYEVLEVEQLHVIQLSCYNGKFIRWTVIKKSLVHEPEWNPT